MNRHNRNMIIFVVLWIAAMSVFFSMMFRMAVGAFESLSSSGGAKPVIEKLWCGKPDCMGESK